MKSTCVSTSQGHSGHASGLAPPNRHGRTSGVAKGVLSRRSPARNLRAMPARPRDCAPGIHHVWVNATSHWPYFVDDIDRLTWIRLLGRVRDRCGWRVPAFCQMTTHVHALFEVPNDTLSAGMEY